MAVLQLNVSDGLQVADFSLLDHITISTQRPLTAAFLFACGNCGAVFVGRETVATILSFVTVTDQAAEEPRPQTVATHDQHHCHDLNDNPRTCGSTAKRYRSWERHRRRDGTHTSGGPPGLVRQQSSPKTPPFFHEILNRIRHTQNHIGVETGDNGLIRVKTLLPFEYRLIQSLTFQLVIRDAKEGFAMQTTVAVTLVIIDVNNFQPRITIPPNYNPSNTSSAWECLETDIRTTFIPLAFLAVEAEDDDSEEFMPLNYFLSYDEAPQLEGYVEINITTGVVSVVRPLDREAPGMAELMMLTIRVMDNANRGYNQQTSAGTRIAFRVIDRNDNPPILHFNNIVLDQGAAFSQQISECHNGTVNIDFYATDADSTPSTPPFYPILTVFPAAYRTHFDTFSDRTGLIRLLILKTFDYRLVQKLNITLTVYDSDPNTPFDPILNTAVTVWLEILDTNNLIPRVSYPINYDPTSPSAELFFITETDSRNASQFTAFPVLTVKAVDDDSDQFMPLDYFLSFELAPCLQGFMEIDRSTGVVSVVKPLDREATGMNETLVVEVFVMDNAKQSFNQLTSRASKIAFRVTDLNDNPPDVRFNGQAIPHLGNVTVDVTEHTCQEVLLDLYASDRDSVPKTPPFFHEILNLDPTYQNHIGVETGDNGLIRVKTLLPFEYRLIQRLTFLLVIRDAKEGFAMRTTIAVTLVINSELPQFTGPPTLTFSVDENWTGPIRHGIITAADADATANLIFSITFDRAFDPDGLQVADFPFPDHITISTQRPSPPAFPYWRGQLMVRRSLDRETVATILAIVTVTDQAAEEPRPQTVTTMVSITVNDLNDNPPDVRFNGQAIPQLGNVTVDVTERTRQEVHLDLYASDRDSVPKTPPFFHEILNLDPIYQNHIAVETGDNGLIRVKTLLPFEYRLIQRLTFQLVIRDAKEGFAMRATVTVTLVIIDVNNFLPRITIRDLASSKTRLMEEPSG
ncbi:hypothetical protein BV898_13588 [Hypsibius exemplaris]|uniref:Cadherin domain-containing protein n=1 Tax=Hypsibius exemplaris TaxID=2072580 RepID=A0A1W0WA66_HYPEX|nr:hypothetical protein BV898_13588 [Hypsibius exemplaris]